MGKIKAGESIRGKTARILQFIEEHPWPHTPKEVASALGIKYETVKRTLLRLYKKRKIAKKKRGIYCAKGTQLACNVADKRDNTGAQSCYRNVTGVSAEVLRYLERIGRPCTLREIALALGVPRNNVKMPVRRLARKGLISNPEKGVYCYRTGIHETLEIVTGLGTEFVRTSTTLPRNLLVVVELICRAVGISRDKLVVEAIVHCITCPLADSDVRKAASRIIRLV